MERFAIDGQRAAGKKYFEFLRTGQMSAGVRLQGSGVAAAMEVLQHSATCQARYPG